MTLLKIVWRLESRQSFRLTKLLTRNNDIDRRIKSGKEYVRERGRGRERERVRQQERQGGREPYALTLILALTRVPALSPTPNANADRYESLMPEGASPFTG